MRAQDNELLTRTDPGTGMGALFRRYWVPALLAEELPVAGGQPKRVQLLGEHLVAFRTGSGALGLVEEACAHRRASLAFGRTEADGLRCPFHGWKYGPDGRCIEMPSEPPTSTFRERIGIASYPVRERGGVIWAFMGEAHQMPELPEFEWTSVPEERRFVSKRLQDCNYLQALEGGIDASHVSVLHADARAFEPLSAGAQFESNFADVSPKFYVEPTDYGLAVVAERTRADGRKYCRITQLMMPWYTLIAPVQDGLIGGHAFVPVNDEQVWVWSIDYHPERNLTHLERRHFSQGGGIHSEVDPITFVPVRNKTNDYLRSPYLQNMGSVTGIVGIANQDAAVQESMGPIVDRTREHLGSSDAGIIVLRRRLRSLAAGAATADELPGLRTDSHRVRSAGIVLEPGMSWPDVRGEVNATAQVAARTGNP